MFHDGFRDFFFEIEIDRNKTKIAAFVTISFRRELIHWKLETGN